MLRYNPHLKLYSEFGETDKAFQRRCREAAEEAHDEEAKKLRAKYERELDRLEDRLQREERELEEDKIEHDARKQEELLSGVESVFGLFAGRKSSTRPVHGQPQAAHDPPGQGRHRRVGGDCIEELEEADRRTGGRGQARSGGTRRKVGRRCIDEVEEEEVRPRRADVRIELFALAWLPRWEVVVGGQTLSMPAFQEEPA